MAAESTARLPERSSGGTREARPGLLEVERTIVVRRESGDTEQIFGDPGRRDAGQGRGTRTSIGD
jgi:hypothetical protein